MSVERDDRPARATLAGRRDDGAARLRRRRARAVGALLAVLALAYLGSGIYLVDTDEQGVVRRFGTIVARVGPGIHYRLPWPVDQADVLKTTTVMKSGVGFALPEVGDEAVIGMQLLTGDTNIINVALALQYIITSPADYLFQCDAPQAFVASIAESFLTETVVTMPVDEVLTIGRLAISEQVKSRTQETLDRYQTGIQITSVNIMTLTLDDSVAESFQKVTDAIADRQKKINEAKAYANNLLPKARGEAHATVLAAKNYKERRVAEAVGKSRSFLALLAEYEKAPDITQSRLYLEAMEKILPNVKKYVIDSDRGRVPFNLRVTDP